MKKKTKKATSPNRSAASKSSARKGRSKAIPTGAASKGATATRTAKPTAAQIVDEIDRFHRGEISAVSIESRKYLDALRGFESLLRDPASPFNMAPFGGANIVAVKVGQKHSGGQRTPEPALIIYVVDKHPDPSKVGPTMIPGTFQGVATDVQEVGPAEFAAGVPSGDGVVGFRRDELGTIACVVKTHGTADPDQGFLLSNTHVLARGAGISDQGANVFSGVNNVVGPPIGQLARWAPPQSGINIIDAAIAEIRRGAVNPKLNNGTLPINPDPILAPTVGMRVMKVGFATDATFGKIVSVDAQLPVSGHNFAKQLMIQSINPATNQVVQRAFADSKDSGALVIEIGSHRPVGLLFAKSRNRRNIAYANWIERVIFAFQIKRFVVDDSEISP